MRRLMLLTCLILPLLVGCDWQLFVFAQPVIDPEAAQEFDIVGEWRGEPDNDFPHIRPEPVTIRPAHDDGSYGVTSKSLNGANTRLRMTVLPNTDSNALVEIEMPFEGESVRILALAKVDGDELYFAHLNGASLIKVLIEERITAKTQRHGIFTAIDCDSSKLVPVISAHWRDLATDSCVLHRMKTSDALRN